MIRHTKINFRLFGVNIDDPTVLSDVESQLHIEPMRNTPERETCEEQVFEQSLKKTPRVLEAKENIPPAKKKKIEEKYQNASVRKKKTTKNKELKAKKVKGYL